MRDGGVNFAVAADRAESVTVCLFDGAEGAEAEPRVPLTTVDDGVWHGFVPGIGPGIAYGFRVDGERDPARGLRADPQKLLLDPYAQIVIGSLTDHPDLVAPDRDSAPYVPRSVIPASLRSADRFRRATPYSDSVIYEAHVKGMTAAHPAVPVEQRGTFAGFAHDAVLEHLTDLGVTAVELLPVQHFETELGLLRHGRANYWGYNPIAWFAPHLGYSAAARAGHPEGVLDEFATMVDRLHDAGLEVILDVVYNHTAEGDETGPTLCFRGLDNAEYYHLDRDDPSRYLDTTGCGNSFRANSPRGLRLVMDSLRHWVTVMGVDGFRFDLAATLGRSQLDRAHDCAFDPQAPLFEAIAQDPVLSAVKLIAEPWDVGRADSHELGRFPSPWVEWNGAYRDCVRDFWRSHEGRLAEFATRLTGSSDLYGAHHRRPLASVNFVTAHDGFTLRDLVSYDRKHNEANGEHNRDGTDDNRSWNCGAEGATDDVEVLALRSRQQRALLATLLLSFGVPMLLGGDELGRTQRGNNNPYSHDDEISWVDWRDIDGDLLAFTRNLLAFRAAHPAFRRRRFLGGAAAEDLTWFGIDARPMSSESWADPGSRSVVLHLDGSRDPDLADDGTPLVDDDFLLVVNAWWEPIDVVLPEAHGSWQTAVDTFSGEIDPPAGPTWAAGQVRKVGPRTLVVLRSLTKM